MRSIVILLIASLAPVVSAEQPFWPDANLDASIPGLADVVGHEHGEAISSPAQIDAYNRALAAAAPDRVRLVEYARSWEGRPLSYLVIGSKQNIARLDEIKGGMQRLADPRDLADDEAKALVASLPAVIWFSYGIHGDEISSGDAGLLLARYLLASNNEAFRRIMDNTLVVIDPAQNPDGRARFTHNFEQNRGIEPSPSPIAAERNEPWPAGRTNHYLFDMNRDWFALTQPETRGRVAALLEFYPLVHVDVHEMGTNETYYFPPPAKPFNPHITDAQKAGLDRLGEGMAAAFDRFGFDYFTREVFDALYPGYGDSWPTFHGSLGMTFEMASARGLAGERDDGSIVTYRDGVHRHFVATVGTLLTAADDRERLLSEFVAFRRAATDDDHIYGFSIDANDPALVHRIADRLSRQGVDVTVATEALRLCGETLPAESIIVDAGQPAGRLVRTLLDENSPMRDAFVAEQERRRAKGLSVQLYDVLAWSLPAAYGLDMVSCTGNVRGEVATWTGAPRGRAPSTAKLAWLVPWDSRASAVFLAKALRHDITMHTSTLPFTQNAREFPAGTLVIKVRENDADTPEVITSLAVETGADVVATDTSWTDEGSNFGSEHVRRVDPPRIALAWDEPTLSNSAGATRFVLEREFGYPVTPVRTSHLDSRELDAFDVLVLPDGQAYESVLGEHESARIRDWVERGGILVAFARAVGYLTGAELLPTQPELKATSASTNAGDKEEHYLPGTIIEQQSDLEAMTRPTAALPDNIPGVLMRGEVDPDHWLGAGTHSPVNFMIRGNAVYDPLDLDEGVNVVRFAGTEELLAGGYLWEENRRQWAYKPAVMTSKTGAGHVIAFVGDPTFRAFMNGLDILLANAVFRGPAYRDY